MEENIPPTHSKTSIGGRTRTHSNTMNSYLHLDADKVLSAFGKFGRYQMVVYFLTNSVSLLFAMNMMVMPFITEEPKFACNIKEPEGVKWEYEVVDKCTVVDSNNWTVQCSDIPGAGYVYEGDVHETLASEFNLVCKDYDSTEHASSIFLLGGMLAAPLITQLSDLVGRRSTFLFPLYLSVICNLAAAWVPNYTLFLILRFLSGFGTTGFCQTAFILCTESVSTKFRDLVPALPTVIWVTGYMLSGALKLLIKDWRWLYFTISVPGILTIPLWWYTPESLHWLINNNKHRQVKKYILTANRVNRTKICLSECRTAETERDERPRRSVVDIFTHRGLFLQLCLNAYVTIVMNFTYWALSLFSTELSEDKMTGFFLSGLVELPAGIIGTYLMVVMPRRIVSSLALFLQGFSLILAVYVPGSRTLLMVFPLAAKVFNCVAWAVQPLIVTEMAPTTVRNIFSGIIGFVGDLGSVLSPYLKRLENVHPSAPALIIALTSFFAGFCVLLMPETKDKKMPDDLDAFDPGPLGKYLDLKERTKQPVRKETAFLLEPIVEECATPNTSTADLEAQKE